VAHGLLGACMVTRRGTVPTAAALRRLGSQGRDAGWSACIGEEDGGLN
jgi:hypothetical protein